MRKFVDSFRKMRKKTKRTLSLFVVFTMVITMLQALPAGLLTVKADGVTNITVHFNNDEWNWSSPALQYWGGTSTTPSDYVSGPTEISGWDGAQGYVLTPEENNWYKITLKGDFNGFQFLDMNNSSNNTAGAGFNTFMTQYTAETPQDLYYDKTNQKWYLDAGFTTELSEPEGFEYHDLTLHFYNTANWENVKLHAWNAS